MADCPFFKYSWGYKYCLAIGGSKKVEPHKSFRGYCEDGFFASEHKKCPLYKNATKEKDSSCYLTTACMVAKEEQFKDDCYELEVLRNFRDTYVKENYSEDIQFYYDIAPRIVAKIGNLQESQEIFARIYDELVLPCCKLIENKQLQEAYTKYKEYSLDLSEKYL